MNVYLKTLARASTTCLIAVSSIVFAQNYEREERLADEVIAQLVVGDAVRIATASGKAFLGLYAQGDGKKKPAVLLIHGVGTHPDFGVTGQLRSRLNDLGYTTLAIQMPVQARDAKLEDYYPTVFANAKDRIATAVAWLRAKGFEKPVVLSHTMGSWMVNEYLDQHHSKNEFSAWVCMSLTGSFSWTTRSYGLPIFDVYAEKDIPVSVSSAWRRKTALLQNQSRQYQVAGAGVDYVGKEAPLAEEVALFIGNLN